MVFFLQLGPFSHALEPANPQANAKARAILNYLEKLPQKSEKRLVSGQFTDFGPGAKLTNCQDAFDKTGHWPATIGLDYADFGKGGVETKTVNRMAIGGTYGRAGWSGRPVDGTDGWSARGLFDGQKDGRTPIGFYCYHMDMKGIYGSNWVWDRDELGFLENNRWYCIEQYVKLNTPSQPNGVLRGWVDAIATGSGAHDVVIDHCSTSWATDENLSASGERFSGATVEQWRQGTSHRVTISHCIIAEGLDHSTHGKGAHSKGSLIHDNATDIAVIANLYASNGQRNPYFKGGARGLAVNNLIDNPGSAAIHYGLQLAEWGAHPWALGQIAIVGNVLNQGPDTRAGLPLFSTNGTPCEVFLEDNLAVDRAGNPVRLTSGIHTSKDSPPTWPPGLQSIPASEVKQYVLANAGARPWDRDAVDRRIIQQVRDGTGRIPDSEQEVGGYPNLPETLSNFLLDGPADIDRWSEQPLAAGYVQECLIQR